MEHFILSLDDTELGLQGENTEIWNEKFQLRK